MDKFLQGRLDGKCPIRTPPDATGNAGAAEADPAQCVKAHWLGRATRHEYFVVLLICIFLNAGVANMRGGESVRIVMNAAIGIVLLAESIRRLHDRGMSGWWVVLYLIPFVGLVMSSIKGQSGPNKYGPDPREPKGERQ